MNPSDLTAIKRALVKIWFKSGEDSFFKGTGFFVHSDGYLLTAYHCIKDCKNNIVVESLSVGKKRAVIVPELSLPGADIAVLQLSDPSMENTAPHYLPLGFVTDAELNSDVVVLGYPQRDGAQWVAEVATYRGHINRLFQEGEVFFLECQAIVGKGQSDSPVYHPATRRVVAVAHSMYEEMRSGDAVRFEPLFQSHPKLKFVNQKSELIWERQQNIAEQETLQRQQEELQRLQQQYEHEERELQQQRAEIQRKEVQTHEWEQKLAQQSEELQRLQQQCEHEEQEFQQQQAGIQQKQQVETARLKQVQEKREIEKQEWEWQLAALSKQQEELHRLQIQQEHEKQKSQQQQIQMGQEIARLKQLQAQREWQNQQQIDELEQLRKLQAQYNYSIKNVSSRVNKIVLQTQISFITGIQNFTSALGNGLSYIGNFALLMLKAIFIALFIGEVVLLGMMIIIGILHPRTEEPVSAPPPVQLGTTWFFKGNILYSQGKLEEAIAAYRKQLAIDPKHGNAWFGIGNVLDKQGKLEDAIAAYSKQLDINPKHVEAWRNKGRVLYRLGKLDEALNAYHKALEINPKHELAWNNMGVTLEKQGKLDEAISAYRKQLEINPKNEYAKNNLDRLLKK